MKKYRTNGAVGALLDEYEKSIEELKLVLETITEKQLVTIADPDTNDPDCRSIQTILSHVIRAGYGYAICIRKAQGEKLAYKEREVLHTIVAYQDGLDEMFAYNDKLFKDYPDLKLEEYDLDKKMLMRWGQKYDVDQLMEHAIVHVLRHRRQIERFLQKMID